MATTPMQDGKVGAQVALESVRKSGGRCRGSRRAKRSPGAPNTPTPCGCPACCTAKIFRSTVAHGRIKSIDASAAQKMPGVHRVVTSRGRAQGHPRALLRPGLPRPADPRDRQGALRRRAGRRRARRRSACCRGGGAADRAPSTRSCRRCSTRSRPPTTRSWCTTSSSPPGTFADLKHLKGRKGTNVALDFQLRRGDVDKAFAEAAHVFEHTFRTQKCCTSRSSRIASIGDWKESGLTIYSAAAGPVVRAHRDRAPARLAGEPRARQGALSRRRLRRQALHQARSAGDRALHDRAAAGEGRAHHGGAVLYHHQAPQHVPHQDRASTRAAASPRASARCTGTAAPMPISARA